MRVLFLAHTSADSAFKVGSHHYSRELAKRGHVVWHVSTPLTVKGLFRESIAQRRREWVDEFGVNHWKPMVPLSMTQSDNLRFLWPQFRARALDQVDIVVVDQPRMRAIVSRLCQRTPMVYRPTDIVDSPELRLQQRELVDRASAVVATSSSVLLELDFNVSIPHRVIPNGVETEHFQLGEKNGRNRNGFVYVGSLGNRFDWEAIRILSEEFPEHPIDIFGPLQGPPPRFKSNVSLRGEIAYLDLPAVYQRYQVGLLPLSSERINQGRSPMKFYEYSAAGLAILATRTRSLTEDFGLDSARHAFGYENYVDLVAKARQALDHSVPDMGASEAAAQHSWARKAEELEELLDVVLFGRNSHG